MVSVHDAAGVYEYVSPASRRLFGWRPEELVGHGAYSFFYPADIRRIQRDHEAHESGRDAGAVAYRLRCGDGSYRAVETTSRPVLGEDGQVAQIVCLTYDVEERRERERRLLLAQAGLVGQGLLGDRVLQDVRNGLTAALANVETARRLLERGGHPDSALAALANVESAARRVHQRTTQFADVYGAGSMCRSEGDLRLAVETAAALIDGGEGLTVTMPDPETSGLARGPTWKLTQVVAAMLGDALRERLTQGGDGEVKLGEVEVEMSASADALLVRVTYPAEGSGVDELDMRLDPRAHEVDSDGREVELWVARHLAESLGASIGAESQDGRGVVCLTVARAVVPRRVRKTPAPRPTPPPGDCRLRVLVIDDEDLVRESLGDLCRLFADVRTTGDVGEARRLMSGDEFDLVLCDFSMPDATGIELMMPLVQARPELVDRLVLMTGDMWNSEVERWMELVHGQVLPKPFSTDELERVLDRAHRHLL